MKIVHFTGEGRGFYSGISEYVIVIEDEDVKLADYCAAGFTVKSEMIIDDVPPGFPTEQTLVPRI